MQLLLYLFLSSPESGALITSGIDGGSLLTWNPFTNYQDYLKYDRQLKDTCCGIAELCKIYYERRPSQDCTGYEPPVRSNIINLAICLLRKITKFSLLFKHGDGVILISQLWMAGPTHSMAGESMFCWSMFPREEEQHSLCYREGHLLWTVPVETLPLSSLHLPLECLDQSAFRSTETEHVQCMI